MNMSTLKTIGVDLHKASLTATVLDSAGTVLERKDIPTKCRRQIADYFASHGPQVQVAVESVGLLSLVLGHRQTQGSNPAPGRSRRSEGLRRTPNQDRP